MPDSVDTAASAAVTDASAGDAAGIPTSNPTIATFLKTRVETSKRNRKSFYGEWKGNVELRIGHPITRYSEGLEIGDDVRSEINPDWSLTKAKVANLYSQVPVVQLTHENKQYAGAIPAFAKALNYELGEKRANIGTAMEEVLNDVVNAAGVGAVYVGYAARFADVQVPAVDTKTLAPQMVQGLKPTPSPDGATPDIHQQMMQTGQLPMTTAKQVVSDKFFGQRISPIDLLWPAEFTGSNFDNGDWIGFTGRMSWAEAKTELKLRDDQKQQAVSGVGEEPNEDNLRSSNERAALSETQVVKYDMVFYWRYRVDPACTSFHEIWRIVYVHGMTEPVIHEPWTGQQYDAQSHKYIGVCRFPVRVLTLTYITDNPIPPSDSAAGRPQVNDMRRSRAMMFKNRERSIPIRWFDVNRVDPLIQDTLMRGTVQGMIPTNGDGSRTVGEIARASYPAEDFTFDRDAKADLMESWQIGPNQLGTAKPGTETAGEANIIQQNFSTRIGQERGRVAAFFLSICDVFAGLMALYSDFPTLTDQERQQMQQAWDSKHILHDLVLKIRPDSTVLLDAQTRIARLMQLLNMTVKSGFVNPKPIIVEIVELSGLDPSEVIVDPQPPTEDPNMSYRFSGKDDLMNPLVVAMLIKKGQMPSKEQIEQAKQLLLDAQQPSAPPTPPGMPGAPVPGPEPPQPGQPLPDAHPQWQGASKVGQRTRDVAGSQNE